MNTTDRDHPINHPTVEQIIRAALAKRGTRPHDLEDAVQKVKLAVLEILAEETDPDVSLDRTQRLARAVAAKQSASEARAGVARTKRKANGIDPLAHAVPQCRHGEDAMAAHIDHSRAIGELARMQQRGELTEGVLDAIDRKENGGEKLTKIAADQKVSRGELKNEIDTARRRVHVAFSALGLTLSVSLAIWGSADWRAGHTVDAYGATLVVPPNAAETLATRDSAERKADELRKVAASACGTGQWKSCRDDLHDAYALDPDGNDTRLVTRLGRESSRGMIADLLDAKTAPRARSFGVEATSLLVAKIAPLSGQSVKLVCAAGVEPSHLCDQLAAGMKKAGWTVTRVTLGIGAGVTHGMVIDVATDASDATQNAADALAEGLDEVNLQVRGPHDMAPRGGAPLWLTVGVQ